MTQLAERATTGGLTDRTIAAGRASLEGRLSGARGFLPFLGPAIIASVAYMDPGNFATNVEAGAKFGYALLWVVLAANLTAMLFQGLSAKLGIVTGESLAALCGRLLPKPVVYGMWAASEVAAMATDLAEILGAAIGLNLLTGQPLLLCLAFAGVVTLAILSAERSGFRPMEIVIAAFVLVIGVCYLIEVAIAPPAWAELLRGTLVPRLPDARAVTLAVGIFGATVMPHAIYLHSNLTRGRMPVNNAEETRRVIGYSNREVLLALGFAGLVNMAMVSMSASVFNAGNSDVAEIETAYHTLVPLLGGAAAFVFLLSLLASGFSSSVVGTMAGQNIMRDFVPFRIPLAVRRLLTMIPSFFVVAAGVGVTDALVTSQVVLSLVLPIPMIALVHMTSRRDVMGEFVNTPLVKAAATAGAVVVLALNALLLALTAGLTIPGLAN
jgi:manganese transport protein